MPEQRMDPSPPVQLLDLTRREVGMLLADWGEPRYRADQLWRWLYQHLENDFGAMTNLPLGLRARLKEQASCRPLAEVMSNTSNDRLTHKTLFQLHDGATIEAVLMLYENRRTVCVSTQVGCAIGCPFCATGLSGFMRQLSPGEIVGQVLHYARDMSAEDDIAGSKPVTHVVLMGMGEPLANYDATWQALYTLNDEAGFGLGARRMTLSTAGLVPGIDRMSRETLQVGLAVSLHAPTDRLRSKLVPINERYPLLELMAACRRYVRRSGRRVTFEYALLQGINDSDQQAEQLAELVKGLRCHVNLIPVNRIEGSPYEPSSRERARSFQAVLSEAGVPVTARVRRGLDIDAGCGQLRARARVPLDGLDTPA